MSGARELGSRTRWLRWMACLSGGFGLSLSAQIVFLVPLRARELGASFDVIGLIVGAGALAPVLLSVALGALIDRLGPRATFVIGTSACVAVSVLYMLVSNYWMFLGLQLLFGIARNLGWVASQTYITSFGTPEERPALTGRFAFFGNAGHMAGPLLCGGAAQVAGFRWAFAVPALYSVVFTAVGLALADTRTGDHHTTRVAQGAGFRSALGLIRLRGMQVALLLTFARLWTGLVYLSFLPLHLVGTGMEPGVVGTVMAVSGFVAALIAPTTGFWTRLASQHTVVLLGLASGGAGLLLAPHVTSVATAYAVSALVGVGSGISLPLLLSVVSSAAPPEKRGVALGLRAMANQSAASAAPIVVGPLITALGMTLGFTAAGLVVWLLLAGARMLSGLDRRERAA